MMFVDPLLAQYERYPYPPISRFALPRQYQEIPCTFEYGTRLAYGEPRSHCGIRILVAGAGTLEALVVAEAHPKACEVVAVDFSRQALRRLSARVKIARLALHKFAPITCICQDILAWNGGGCGGIGLGGKFDFIFASNLLHHMEDPAGLLARLASWLLPGGCMRIVTYPKTSRIWMRATSRWLKFSGLGPSDKDLCARAREIIRKLPENNPIRSCFESHPEIGTKTGLVDAFLNARENPLSPLEWQAACARAGLVLVGESQNETSRSDFLVELLPQTKNLSSWVRLQILDDLLELCANPVLWLSPGKCDEEIIKIKIEPHLYSEDVLIEMGAALERADKLLSIVNLSVTDAIRVLRKEVGPRVGGPGSGQGSERAKLTGLSIIEYNESRCQNR